MVKISSQNEAKRALMNREKSGHVLPLPARELHAPALKNPTPPLFGFLAITFSF